MLYASISKGSENEGIQAVTVEECRAQQNVRLCALIPNRNDAS